MPPAVTYLAKSSDLGTQNSQPGEIVLEATALLYAHTTPLSAQITVWYLHKDLWNSPPDWLAWRREDPLLTIICTNSSILTANFANPRLAQLWLRKSSDFPSQRLAGLARWGPLPHSREGAQGPALSGVEPAFLLAESPESPE